MATYPRYMGIGPQSKKDSPFAARMRFHQSWYRANVLQVPYGPGPWPTSKSYYGNMLTQQDGWNGLNFLSPQIFRVVNHRLDEKTGMIDRFRLFSNMLSSQPMCFNLFGPLVDNLQLATRFFQAIYPGEVAAVTKVKFEYAPTPPKEYLNDQTAFDAFIEYLTFDDEQAFIGIETKLVEPFSKKEYQSDTYWKWTRSSYSHWQEENLLSLKNTEVNQLWRDHLLEIALRNHPCSSYNKSHFLVVYHPGDNACSESLSFYHTLLKPQDDSFQSFPLDRLIECWRQLSESEEVASWLNSFSRRYLSFEESEKEFNAIR